MIDYTPASVHSIHGDPHNITADAPPHNPTSLPASAKDAFYTSPTSQTHPVIWESIPATLRARKQWVCYHIEERHGRKTKVPLRVRSVAKNELKRADSTSPASWASYGETFCAYHARWMTPKFPEPPKPGFVFAAGGELLGIDLDNARDPATGELVPIAARIIAEHPGYWEVSPSGTGVKGFFVGSLPEGWKGKKAAAGGIEIEVYDRGRFFCVTGHRLEGASHDLTLFAGVAKFLAEFFPPKANPAPQERTMRTQTSGTRATLNHADVRIRTKRARARGWLGKGPGAVTGQNGGPYTMATCAVVARGFDLPFDNAFEELCEWNKKCTPPWDEVAEGGRDSLRRKLRDAVSEPGERGWMLRQESPLQPSAGSDEITQLFAAVKVPESIGCVKSSLCTDCGESTAPSLGFGDLLPRCRCRKSLYPVCESCDGKLEDCLTCSLNEQVREQVRHEPEERHVLNELVGDAPIVSACPKRKKKFWSGATAETANYDALVWVACDCWGCLQCRTRNRWKMKNENVPFSLSHGTHHWRGTAKECNAMCKRLDRAKIQYALYWVALGGDERAAVLHVASDQIEAVPDTLNLIQATGEQCARKLAYFIELIPTSLQPNARRYGTRGPLEWAPETMIDVDAEAAGEGGEPDQTEQVEEHPFEASDEIPFVDSDDEFVRFLWEIDAEQERRGVPERERVNPRQGTLSNWHTGGAIEGSVIWRRPDDPDLIERIRSRLFPTFLIPD